MLAPAAPPPAEFTPALLPAVLAVSLTAIHLVHPLYGPDGATIVDFALDYLNPAGQRMTGLPEYPGGTALTRFPHTVATGIFAFYRHVYETGATESYEINYQADGLDNYFRFAAQRVGEQLVVSFTDTADQDRTPVEVALRESQAAERAARAEAEAQRQRFYEVLMQMPAQVAVHEGPDQVFTLVNSTYQRLAPGRDLLGQPIQEAWPELANQGILEILDRVYRTGEPFVGTELPFQVNFTRTGRVEQVYFNAFFLPLRDAQGRVHGVLDFSYDVTEQVQARRQLQQLNQDLEARVAARAAQAEAAAQRREQEREAFTQIFAHTPAAICIQRGPLHRYEYFNAAYQQFFPGRTLLGQTVAEALPETVEAGVVGLLDHVYQTGETYFGHELPLLVAQPDGQPPRQMYFTFTYQAYRENGEIVGISTFAYDVAEQVQARQQREAQQLLLREVFAQAPVAIFVLRGPTYVLEVVNAPMGELLGHPPADLLGKPYFEAVPELASQGYPELLADVWRTGLPHVAQEREAQLARHRPGELGYFTFVYQPLRDGHDQVTGILCVATDVTDQVRARQQVQQLNQELTGSNAQLTRTNVDLDNFIYTASHDLKAPITNIEGLLLALREHLDTAGVPPDELMRQLLDLMQGAVERFQLTIAQLTDIARLQQAHDQPAEEVAVAAVVEAVRLDLAPQLAQATAQLTVDVPPGLRLSWPPRDLRSIVYNLLSNAVKYRHPDRPPRVQLRAVREGGHVTLDVQDNGLGLTEHQQSQLFGIFRRLHTHVEGTGVGLYMVKRMVENGGGTITVHSQPDVGTTFRVTFPV